MTMFNKGVSNAMIQMRKKTINDQQSATREQRDRQRENNKVAGEQWPWIRNYIMYLFYLFIYHSTVIRNLKTYLIIYYGQQK